MLTRKCSVNGCNGHMVYTYQTYESFPPQYRHNCDVCASEILYFEIYGVEEKNTTPSADSIPDDLEVGRMVNVAVSKFRWVGDYRYAVKYTMTAIEYTISVLDSIGNTTQKAIHERMLKLLDSKLHEYKDIPTIPSL